MIDPIPDCDDNGSEYEPVMNGTRATIRVVVSRGSDQASTWKRFTATYLYP